MRKLKLPPNPYNGLKVYCNICKADNPKCKHFESYKYRIRIHISGTKNKIRSKVLSALSYEDALKEAINFKADIIANDYERIQLSEVGNDYSVTGAILKYYKYLDGEHEYSQMKKIVSTAHRDEYIRFCIFFSDSIKKNRDSSLMKVCDVNRKDVAHFYSWAENHYSERTFNKCMGALKSFFTFLIDVEEIQMKNPFKIYNSKFIPKSNIETLTKVEFEGVLKAVEENNPIKQLGGKGEQKNMYRTYLIDSYILFLLTGGRREEIVDLKWNNIYISSNGTKFFKILNLKVYRATKKETFKYIPIGKDLFEQLIKMGYNEITDSNQYIIYPERTISSKTIMDCLSKSFTHYKISSGIKKDISLKNLRKTYLSWVNATMQKDTRILSDHSTSEVLENFYIDPTILSSIEKGALEIKVFG